MCEICGQNPCHPRCPNYSPDENEIILKHFIDSITINKYLKGKKSVLDIGTGAGFPGMTLKTI